MTNDGMYFRQKPFPMRPQDYFGLIVRTFGLLSLVLGLIYMYDAAAAILGISAERIREGWTSYLVMGAIMLSVALYLLRGAPALMRYAYRDPEKQRE
jgi:hypothetical protein